MAKDPRCFASITLSERLGLGGLRVFGAATCLGVLMLQGCRDRADELRTPAPPDVPPTSSSIPTQASAFVRSRTPDLSDCGRGLTRRVVVRVRGQLSAEGGTLQSPEVRAAAQFKVEDPGKTDGATSITSVDLPDFAACVRPRVAAWRFPKPSLRPPATSATAHAVRFGLIFAPNCY
ncbi:hypothetical protein WME97_41250 [Sorangium sp. So ce367]|uniref:hypothetical protein n=1 Tax=Sorangium sp. So ce367 TaxID=3133305 RepID=UPI003F5E609F